ncbi:class I SAM-dependent methyltransferase [Saccharopolyspora sp. HNM0986]|uniref:class I SAM-dependent methyltransferase n=1 Tax=Saccharopolyspora galaxeae TaxID=2781241 RepID=UPI00190C0645|nr:class I SAM-dependent methyltransferase [Saccharopolyspora sp. HNM0986]MBK0867550.1 class I SAM-dependent methyltransferase [Saccharopolyspora sp. HNM0986]
MAESTGTNEPGAWESYWQLAGTSPDLPVPWHFGTAEDMAPYLPMLLAGFDSRLPLVDAGCGNGGLTEHFAEHFETVLGTDVAAAALEKAHTGNGNTWIGRTRIGRTGNGHTGVRYEQLDSTDLAAVRALHERIGDANVHLRGVLHAMAAEQWPNALAGLAVLTGQRGRVFDVELSERFTESLAELAECFGEWPEAIREAATTGLWPAELPAQGLTGLYRRHGWLVLEAGELALSSRVPLPDGTFLHLPFEYALVRRHA